MTKSQKRGLATTVQPKPEFSRTCSFREVLGRTASTQNCIKIVGAVFEIWTKNIKNAPKMGFFPICDPKIFFKNRALTLLYTYGALLLCKRL